MAGVGVRLVAAAALVLVMSVALAEGVSSQGEQPVVLPNVGSVVEGDAGPVLVDVPVRLSEASASTVTVQWNTITMPLINPALSPEENVDYQAASGQVTFSPGDTEEMVSITVNGDGDPEFDELIVVKFHDPTNATIGGFYGLGVGVITDDDGPPPPTLTVTPSTDLDGGDVVTVSGTNWRPNYTVGLCQADAMLNDPPQSRCRERVGGGPTWAGAVGTDSEGNFSTDYRIDRWIDVASRGGFIDCIDPATPCVLGAGEVNSGVPDGPVVTVPLSFADPPAPPATRGVVAVTPSTDLIWGETLTVTGTGFRPDAEIEVYPCLDAPTVPSDCDLFFRVDTTADGGGSFLTTMPASQFILGGVDCEAVPCAVGAVEAVDFVGTITSTPIAFVHPPPVVLPAVASVVEGDAPSTVEVDVPVSLSGPSAEEVTVQWETMLMPQVNSSLLAEAGADYTAASGVVTFVPDDVDEVVTIEVAGDAIGESDELIVVRFHSPTNAVMGGFYGLGVGVIEDDDERLLTATPATGLNGGDVITVSGSGWPPDANIGMCQADAAGATPAQDACRGGTGSIVQTPTDANGNFSVDYGLLRWFFVPSRTAFIDCTDPATPCVLGAAQIISGAPVGLTLIAPLPFADPPPPPATRGVITVTPSVDVVDGELLTVTGTGFRADAKIELYPCLDPVTTPMNCAWDERVDTVADGAGAFEATMTAAQFIFGNNNCATKACVITAAEAVDFLGTFTTTPIAFAPAPP